MKTKWIEHDGGRKAAGYVGDVGDCFCRAVAIAAQLPYKEAYAIINEEAKRHPRHKSSARDGVHKATADLVMRRLSFCWTPLMKIGSGCTVHLHPTELPTTGRLVLRLSKHFAAFIDGALLDTYDCSRDGTRCVYGYWTQGG